jgi:hypothetical protein
MPAPRMPGKHRSSEIHCSRALHVLLKQTEDATFRNACNADEQRGGLVARPGARTICWAMLVRSDVVGRGATAGAVLQSQRQLPAMPRAGGRRHGCGPHARARFSHTARAQTTRMRPSITIRSAASAACRPRARGPRARPPPRRLSRRASLRPAGGAHARAPRRRVRLHLVHQRRAGRADPRDRRPSAALSFLSACWPHCTPPMRRVHRPPLPLARGARAAWSCVLALSCEPGLAFPGRPRCPCEPRPGVVLREL